MTPWARRHFSVPLAFQWEGGKEGLHLTEAELRLQVAVMADGYFPNQSRACVVCVKKARKVERLHDLLHAAGVPFKERVEPSGLHVFRFQAPLREKSYGPSWWRCTRSQIDVIAGEVLHWDGSARLGLFFSRDKASADFVQLAFTSRGQRASLHTQQRRNGSVDYVVKVAQRRRPWGHLPLRTWREEPEGRRMYCFEVPSGFLVLRRSGFIFCTGNTGKSLCAIGLANGLRAAGTVTWALVLCPASLKGTWGSTEGGEIHLHARDPGRVLMLRGDRERRMRDWREALRRPGFTWVVQNYEQFAVDPTGRRAAAGAYRAFQEACALAEAHPGLLIADESTMVKSPDAKRSRAVQELARHFRHRLILTGTPVTRSPLDVFCQFEVLKRGALGFPTYLAFERHFARYARRQAAGRHFLEVVGYQHLDDLERRVGGLSYRVTAAECLDLPPVVVRKVPVELSPAQLTAVAYLKKDLELEIGGARVDATHVLTRLGKVAQVLGGFIYADAEGRRVERHFDPNPKLDALVDFLRCEFADPEAKAVVFCNFVPELRAVFNACAQAGWGPVEFHGSVSEADREAGRQRFGADPSCRVFVAQYQAGARGLNLVAANCVAFYSLTFNLEDYLQARKRVHRKGQRRTVTEAYFLAESLVKRGPVGTLDHVILAALREKKGLADVVTGDARKVMEAL
ncbi:MAG: DEAD/DEAH box helicase [Myxococcaceae bacterium]|nr:DEAD/DEAH box helicase [Myxococcaceae bacterium]